MYGSCIVKAFSGHLDDRVQIELKSKSKPVRKDCETPYRVTVILKMSLWKKEHLKWLLEAEI